jgi:hypothetical protein
LGHGTTVNTGSNAARDSSARPRPAVAATSRPNGESSSLARVRAEATASSRVFTEPSVPKADDHALEFGKLPLFGGDVERLDIHEGALDGG